ncbi:hypothetical protein L596_009707 [Steinernema carpocapsae]|uniref:Uncharacterized protein n=1 Tax=Steinernema carpocapsae TaxID=34508 RepID=A0A4U5PGN2_STECR|nr:hypothetical protein L596_009707 [Steinernema carpocapsae]
MDIAPGEMNNEDLKDRWTSLLLGSFSPKSICHPKKTEKKEEIAEKTLQLTCYDEGLTLSQLSYHEERLSDIVYTGMNSFCLKIEFDCV